MKKSTLSAGFCLLALAGTTAMAALSEPVKVNGIYYQVTGENTCRVMPDAPEGPTTNSYEGNIIVPSTVEIDGKTYKVNEIGKDAFSHCWDLTGVTLPPTIERLDSNAFASSRGITSMTLPASLRVIESNAFGFSGLRTLTIEEGLDSIGYGGLGYLNSFADTLRLPASLRAMSPAALAFSHSVEAFSIDPTNPYWKSENGVVFSKDGSTLFAFPCNKYEEKYQIPSSVKYIESDACSFLDHMTAFEFPYTQMVIGKRAFYSSNKIKTVENAINVAVIDSAAFDGCTNLEYFEAGYGLKRIGDSAFRAASSYNDNGYFTIGLDYANNLTSIGKQAFQGAKMQTIRIPQNVDTISPDAFRYTTLAKFDVNPANKSYTSINGVLYNKDLTKLVVMPPYYGNEIFDMPAGVEEIGEGAFFYARVKLVNFPESIRTFGREAFSGAYLVRVDIPSTIEELPEDCFAHTSLTKVTVPATVKSMEGGVFSSCHLLEEATLPDELEELAPGTFYDCSVLSKFNIPAEAKKIGYNAFAQCFAIDSINIPDACLEIEDNAFRTTNNPMREGQIKKVVLGKNLQTIGKQAFEGQYNIEAITSYNVTPPEGEGVFTYYTYDNATVSIYEDAEAAYKGAELWSPFQSWKFMKTDGVEDVAASGSDSDIILSKGAVEARGEGLMQVFTLDGRTLYSGPTTRVEVPAAGMYIVRFGTASKKVML